MPMFADAANPAALPLAAIAAMVSRGQDRRPTGLTMELLGRGETLGGFAIHVEWIRLSSGEPVELAVARLTFDPGGASGWQLPAGPVLVIIVSGTLTKYSVDNYDAQTFTTGQAFVLYGPSDTSMLRNEGTAPTEAIVTCIGPLADRPTARDRA